MLEVSLFGLRVELVVPGREEGGGEVEALAVQRQLQHLRGASEPLALDVDGLGLLRQFCVLQNLHGAWEHTKKGWEKKKNFDKEN